MFVCGIVWFVFGYLCGGGMCLVVEVVGIVG